VSLLESHLGTKLNEEWQKTQERIETEEFRARSPYVLAIMLGLAKDSAGRMMDEIWATPHQDFFAAQIIRTMFPGKSDRGGQHVL